MNRIDGRRIRLDENQGLFPLKGSGEIGLVNVGQKIETVVFVSMRRCRNAWSRSDLAPVLDRQRPQ